MCRVSNNARSILGTTYSRQDNDNLRSNLLTKAYFESITSNSEHIHCLDWPKPRLLAARFGPKYALFLVTRGAPVVCNCKIHTRTTERNSLRAKQARLSWPPCVVVVVAAAAAAAAANITKPLNRHQTCLGPRLVMVQPLTR